MENKIFGLATNGSTNCVLKSGDTQNITCVSNNNDDAKMFSVSNLTTINIHGNNLYGATTANKIIKLDIGDIKNKPTNVKTSADLINFKVGEINTNPLICGYTTDNKLMCGIEQNNNVVYQDLDIKGNTLGINKNTLAIADDSKLVLGNLQLQDNKLKFETPLKKMDIKFDKVDIDDNTVCGFVTENNKKTIQCAEIRENNKFKDNVKFYTFAQPENIINNDLSLKNNRLTMNVSQKNIDMISSDTLDNVNVRNLNVVQMPNYTLGPPKIKRPPHPSPNDTIFPKTITLYTDQTNKVGKIGTATKLGCYTDNGNWNFPKKIIPGATNPETCAKTCINLDRNFVYSSTQNNHCFCGTDDDINRHDLLRLTPINENDKNCQWKCNDGTTRCGGIWANMIYRMDD